MSCSGLARRAAAALIVFIAAGWLLLGPSAGHGSPVAPVDSARAASFQLPRVGHVFVIMLENQGYASTFGDPAADPYLASRLPSQGALLTNYYGTGHESNDNYVSIVSGQPPNIQNQSDCQLFDDFAGAAQLPNGVEAGVGCVYPATVANLGTQLSAKGLNWKAYEGDMGNDPNRESAACGHPALNSQDHTQSAEAGDGYATRHDPFVYFHSVVDNQRYCNQHVVALGSASGAMPAGAVPGETGLATDLERVSTTPAFSFITPNLCDDGHDYPCVNETSGASALADIDRFLAAWVPKITGSPAFRQNGLLEIAFDESGGPQSDSTSCCGELPGPGSPLPGIDGPGGGRVGALLLSPYIKRHTVTTTPYNHYSSLASWEALFGVARLADAATTSSTFGSDVFTAAAHPSGTAATHPSRHRSKRRRSRSHRGTCRRRSRTSNHCSAHRRLPFARPVPSASGSRRVCPSTCTRPAARG